MRISLDPAIAEVETCGQSGVDQTPLSPADTFLVAINTAITGHCACAVPRDLYIAANTAHIFEILTPVCLSALTWLGVNQVVRHGRVLT